VPLRDAFVLDSGHNGGGDPAQRQERMGRRMDIVQLMREQMVQHQQIMQPVPGK